MRGAGPMTTRQPVYQIKDKVPMPTGITISGTMWFSEREQSKTSLSLSHGEGFVLPSKYTFIFLFKLLDITDVFSDVAKNWRIVRWRNGASRLLGQ